MYLSIRMMNCAVIWSKINRMGNCRALSSITMIYRWGLAHTTESRGQLLVRKSSICFKAMYRKPWIKHSPSSVALSCATSISATPGHVWVLGKWGKSLQVIVDVEVHTESHLKYRKESMWGWFKFYPAGVYKYMATLTRWEQLHYWYDRTDPRKEGKKHCRHGMALCTWFKINWSVEDTF